MNSPDTIFLNARELTDPAERAAYLDEACSGDFEIRAQIDALLLAETGANAYFNEAETQEHAPPRILPLVATTQHLPEQIGPYRILERLGLGGMGEVFRAEQRQPFRREVALKLIKLGMDTKQVVARFEAERQAMALMDHPHIAKVYGADADEKGRPYFAMEYVKGIPITEYADINHLTVKERLELFQQVCHAIQHAHQKGVIHRDIKPSNILVSTQDGRPHAKVIDFGIAKATSQQLTDMTVFTLHDQLIGTPQYMSPEQATGSLDIDTRTDVYSLGVLLYELLTGQTPFDQAKLRKAALHEIARILRDEEPPKPSTRLVNLAMTSGGGPPSKGEPGSSIMLDTLAKARSMDGQQLVKEIRGELDWLIMKSLDKDRARRYDSPNSLAEDIGRYLMGSPIEAAPPTFRYRAGKFISKNRPAMIVAGVITGLVLLSLVGTLTGLIQARNSLVREKEATAKAEHQAYVANIGAAQVSMQGESWPEARARLKACPEKLRGWEWQYLRNLASAPEFGFSEPVESVELSSNDRFLMCRNRYDIAVIDLETRRRIWSVTTKEVKRLYSWSDGSTSYSTQSGVAVITREGQVIATSGDTLALFSATSKEPAVIKIEELEIAKVSALSLSLGERYLFIGLNDQNLIVYDLKNQRVALKRMGFYYFTCSEDESTLHGWLNQKATAIDIVTGEERWAQGTSSGKPAGIYDITPDGRWVVLATENKELEIYKPGNEKPERVISKTGPIQEVNLSNDGRYVLGASSMKPDTLQIWDAASGEVLAKTARDFSNPRFSKSGNEVIDPGSGVFWDWRKGNGEDSFHHPAGVKEIKAFTSDMKLAISVENYRVRVWKTDLSDLAPVASPTMPDVAQTGIRLAEFGGRDLFLEEWSAPVSDAITVIFSGGEGRTGLEDRAAARSGIFAAMAAADHTVKVTAADGRELAILKGHEGPVRCLAITPDGSRLVSGSDDGTLRFWETKTWQEVAVYRYPYGIRQMAFAAGASRLVVAFSDKSLQTLDVRDSAKRIADTVENGKEKDAVRGKVDAVLAGNQPWRDLASSFITGESLPVAARIAALDEMSTRLGEIRMEALIRFNKLRSEQVIKDEMERELARQDLQPLVRKSLQNLLTEWKENKQDIITIAKAISAKSDHPRERYEALGRIGKNLLSRPGDRFEALYLSGVAHYRLGDFSEAVRELTEAEAIAAARQDESVDFSKCRAYLAMALFRTGSNDKAQTVLGNALARWRLLDEKELRKESVNLIQPGKTTPSVHTRRIAVTEIASAIKATDDDALEAKMGSEVTVRGKVQSFRPTVAGNQMSILLDQTRPTFTAFLSKNAAAGLNDAVFEELENQEIVVTGRITRRFKNYQVEVGSWSQIALVSEKGDDPKSIGTVPAVLPAGPTSESSSNTGNGSDGSGKEIRAARQATQQLWERLADGQSEKSYRLVEEEILNLVKIDPNDVGTKGLIAACNYRLGDWRKADAVFETIPGMEDLSLVENWVLHTNIMAYRAMTLSRLGKPAESAKALHRALHFWGGQDEFSPLQKEAANLVNPAALLPRANPASAAYKAIADAVEASNSEALKASQGKEVKIKGRISRICPSINGSNVNLFLSSGAGAPLAWINLKTMKDFTMATLAELDGREVVVSGKLMPYGGNKQEWKDRLQITITAANQAQILTADPADKSWWDADQKK